MLYLLPLLLAAAPGENFQPMEFGFHMEKEQNPPSDKQKDDKIQLSPPTIYQNWSQPVESEMQPNKLDETSIDTTPREWLQQVKGDIRSTQAYVHSNYAVPISTSAQQLPTPTKQPETFDPMMEKSLQQTPEESNEKPTTKPSLHTLRAEPNQAHRFSHDSTVLKPKTKINWENHHSPHEQRSRTAMWGNPKIMNQMQASGH